MLLLDDCFQQLGIWALWWPVCQVGAGIFTVLLGVDTKENRFSGVVVIKNKLLCLALSQILPSSY